MNKRLKKIADLIPYGKGIIDVGTDHGYVPIYLAQNGYKGNIIASDINKGPLDSAKKNAEKICPGNRIKFMLSDGLRNCDSDLIDTVVIAGMGGDLIVRILDEAEWCMDRTFTLILQPMTKQEILRYWLCNNGFSVSDHIVHEGRFYYQILSAAFCNKNTEISDAELYVGKFEYIRECDFASEYLSSEIDKFTKDLCGMQKSKTVDDVKLAFYENILSQLRDMRNRVNE